MLGVISQGPSVSQPAAGIALGIVIDVYYYSLGLEDRINDE